VGAGNGHVLFEKLEPFAPVAIIIIHGVELLLVVIGFVSDIENGIHELSAQGGPSLSSGLSLKLTKLAISCHHFIDTSMGLLLKCSKKSFFLDHAILDI
jgi:hypothetical protein